MIGRRTHHRTPRGTARSVGLPATHPSPALRPGRWREAMNDLNRQLGSDGSVLIRPMAAQARIADHRVTGDHATTVVADDGDTIEFEEVDDPSDGLDVLRDRHRRVGIESARAREGRSTRWQVTWSTRCGRSLRKVAELTGHPWTNNTSGPAPTTRWAASPAPTSRNRSGSRRNRSDASVSVIVDIRVLQWVRGSSER